MSTKTQLIGGAFQDSEGRPLVNGYLLMKLSQDGNVSGVGFVCSGITIKIQLDGSGNVSAGQFVWANDIILPVNSYYKVTGYAQNGQVAFGPNNQQVVSGGTGGGTFNTGSWVPNTVFSWNPPVQPLVLQTNETNNGSQTLLDLHAGSGVSLVDDGSGRVTISSAGSNAGKNVCAALPWAIYAGARGSTIALSTGGFTYSQIVFANAIATPCTVSQITINIAVALPTPIGEMCIIKTLKDSLNTVSVTPITFGGNPTPTFGTGDHTSDNISLVIDAAHDYYVCFTGNPFPDNGQLTAQDNNKFLPYFGGNLNGYYFCSSYWSSSVGAGQGFSSFNGTPNAIGSGSTALFLKGWTVVT